MISTPSSSHASLRSAGSDRKSTGVDLKEAPHKTSRSWSVWGGDKAEVNLKRPKTSEESASHSKSSGLETSSVCNIEPSHKSAMTQASVKSYEKNGKVISSASGNMVPQEADQMGPSEHQNIRKEDPTTEGEDKSNKRTWFFWNRVSNNQKNGTTSEVEQIATSSKNDSQMTNTFIPYSETDAILIKGKSATEITEQENIQVNENPHPNIVVPSFDVLPHQTTWTSISSCINKWANSWSIISEKRLKQKCLYRRDPQESLLKLSNDNSHPIKVLIVGVHGFFPTKMIRPFIGEPTGTSIKFISEAEKVLTEYFNKNETKVQISKIALEREGEVMDRVDFFFEVMKSWAKEINQADFVYFVAHSQGCPVTILLLARLIDCGIVNLDTAMFSNEELVPQCKNKKIISILAMAGINNGPFYGADQTLFVRAYQTIEKESLRELFQFQKFDSILSRQLIRSIRIIIRSGVKISFIGSINDQLVPLYSSMCLFAHHPNIFRATFIDIESRTPKFIKRLVNIAGTLINLGYDDHGIIKEISGALAGTLTGGGHSTVYNEAQVYEIGLKFALETTDCIADTPVEFKPFKLDQLGANPFHLPWCMRGLLYETGRRFDDDETHQLFSEFEEWEPETKQLKDMKYRLNGLKSKL